MGRRSKGAICAGLAVGSALAVSGPAMAQTTGSETLKGTIIASFVSGSRVVVGTSVVAGGVFNGGGRVVEVASLPGDPDSLDRDDLVFAAGAMHLLTTTEGGTQTIDPRSCAVTVTLSQTQTVAGGTGRFSDASGSFAGTLTGHGIAPRNPDGTCSDQSPLVERAAFSISGSLSF